MQVLLEESFLLPIQSNNRHLVKLVTYFYSFSLKQNEFCSNVWWQTSAGLRVLFFTFITGGSEMLKHLTTREEHCTATPACAQRGRRDVARKAGSGSHHSQVCLRPHRCLAGRGLGSLGAGPDGRHCFLGISSRVWWWRTGGIKPQTRQGVCQSAAWGVRAEWRGASWPMLCVVGGVCLCTELLLG